MPSRAALTMLISGLVALAAVQLHALTATPTGTPPPASVTPDPSRCVGDCDGTSSVEVSDLVRCVGNALGSALPCQSCDIDGDGFVSINEIVAAVNAALNGCDGGDIYEPDDTLAGARPIACGDEQVHDLSTYGDQDWVVFDAPAGTGVVLVTGAAGDGPIDTTLQLFDDRGLSLAYNDDNSSSFARIEYSCLPSTSTRFYARAAQFSGYPSGRYRLSLTCRACPSPTPTVAPDAFEPNDSFDTASEIGCGEVQRHTAPYPDGDWLSFTIDQRSTVHVTTRITEGYVEFRGAHDAEGTLIDPYGQAFDCGRNALAPGTYVVHLQNNNFGAARYEMGVLCAPCDLDNPTPTPTATYFPTATPVPPDHLEPDSRGAAVPIACGEGLIRSVAPEGDTDWLMLTLSERSAVSVDILSNSYGVVAVLQDNAGRDLTYPSAPIERPCGGGSLEAGTYFIETYLGEYYYGSSPYDVVVRCEPCTAPEPPTPSVPTRTPTQTPLPLDAFEPDNRPAEAGPIVCGELQVHSLHTPRDQDWVTFDIAAPLALSASAGSDLSLELYDQRGGYLGGANRVLDVTCDSAPLPAGSYRLRVASGYTFGALASYNLTLLCQPCAVTATPTPTPTRTPRLRGSAERVGVA